MKTTIMMMTAAAATAVMTVTNWIKKFSHLNRINKEIRIRIEFKSIYNEATCLLDIHFIKKKSMNKKQQQTDLNCSLFVTDFLLCSEYTRCILWSAHTIHSYLHNNYIQTELSVLHSELYVSFFLIWSFFFTCIKKDLFSSFSSFQLISKRSQFTMLTWT